LLQELNLFQENQLIDLKQNFQKNKFKEANENFHFILESSEKLQVKELGFKIFDKDRQIEAIHFIKNSLIHFNEEIDKIINSITTSKIQNITYQNVAHLFT
jgi:hypothetical protein